MSCPWGNENCPNPDAPQGEGAHAKCIPHPDERVAAGLRLREANPKWSLRMILAALDHGEDSEQFREAKQRTDAFPAHFAATGGWMGLR